MGTIRLGKQEDGRFYAREFILFLKNKIENLDTFIETGTYYGNTAKWASKYFKKVITIEASKENFHLAQKNLSNINNIELIFGNSVEIFSDNNFWNKINNENAFFWLDAHWSSEGAHFGKNEECPLMKEIELIKSRKGENYISIDDARMFIFPYYIPKDSSQEHPSLKDIILSLKEKEILIYADTFFTLPMENSKEILNEWRKKYKKTKYDILC
jgi:hypothetical protein